MLTPNNTLICVFSFNMGRTLRNCLKSIERHCPEFHIIIADDASDEPETLRVLDEWKGKAKRIYVSGQPKEGRRHGNLYANIQHACSFAGEMGYRFLFMVQDDMQFVLPLSGGIAHEYGALFNDEDVLSVDPRFARREAIYEIDHLRGLPPSKWSSLK